MRWPICATQGPHHVAMKIDDHDFAAMIAKAEWVTVDISQGEIRGYLSDSNANVIFLWSIF
ncbi:MAG: hypothetical protein QXT02_00525 [Candidatus Hadarchaeum sp.]